MRFENCVFRENHADFGGAGYARNEGTLVFVGCTVAYNSSGFQRADDQTCAGTEVYNSIFFYNDGVEIDNPGACVDSSQVEGGYVGGCSSNVGTSAPQFISTTDLRLQPSSPCIDQGDMAYFTNDSLDINQNGNPTEPAPDALVNFRVFPPSPPCAPDRGAYEYGSRHCQADVNSDGVVNVPDLLMVISAWGTCPSPPTSCPADIDVSDCTVSPNGTVNVNDLLLVISQWGCGDVPQPMPESVSDCFDVYCAGLSGDDWEGCINKCVDAVCQTNPSECE